MEILYISSVPSPGEFSRISHSVREDAPVFAYGMAEASYKFHTLVVNGLAAHPGVHITHLVGRSVGHAIHKGLFWKKRVEQIGSVRYIHLPFVNLPLLKQAGMCVQYYFYTRRWLRQTKGRERAIVLDAAYVTVIPFVQAACRRSGESMTAIVCDVYDYMSTVTDARGERELPLHKRLLRKVVTRAYQKMTSFVFLTEAMNGLLNEKKRPYVVMEGLVDSQAAPAEQRQTQPDEKKIVMYAGALREVYGLKNLVDGFMAYEDPDAALWIFGSGDYGEQIKAAQKQDPRITFWGSVPLDTVVQKEQQVTLLVNPRPAGQEFTKYSFPSKNMEYMASGTPVLTTKLPGMPREYYDYVYLIEADGAQDVTAALAGTLSQTREQLAEKGARARAFVLEKKNNVVQTDRILAMIRGQMGADGDGAARQ